MKDINNIWVFKTTVRTENEVDLLRYALDRLFGNKWSIDLDDCDKVLRIETTGRNIGMQVAALFAANGFTCRELDK